MTTFRLAAALSLLLLRTAPAAAAALTRGPYLQTPTPQSIIVRWRTDTPTSSRVAYGAAPGALTTTVDDPTPATEHVVSLSGLPSGTQYYYSVGSALGAFVGDDADHYFRTAPPVGTEMPLRLWAIGDAGFTGANLNAVRDAYATFNGSSAADLFLLLGDNAYGVGSDPQYQAAVFDEHAAMLRTTPVYSVVGNHEAFSSNSVTQTGPYFDMFSFPTLGEAGGVASGTEAYFSFDYANLHFIVLDSEQAPTSASTPMLTWLESDLQSTTAEWVVALWHRPPYSRGLLHNSDSEASEINMRQYALPILEDYGVDLVLSGHSHSYERSYLLDGHYGPSSTFSSVHQLDPGDGDPGGDGAYRKAVIGPAAHAGAVYVVNGSGSEVRSATLDHPAMVVGLLELGSLVLDIDGPTLTARFLNSSVQVRDAFRIVKGTGCPPVPATGCTAGAEGQLHVVDRTDDTRDGWRWRWRGGVIPPGAIGTPGDQTDLAICVYAPYGPLLGGTILHGASSWRGTASVQLYSDRSLSRHGFRKIQITSGVPAAQIRVRAKGPTALVPSPPLVFPLTAQLVNLDSGACWESVFTTPRRNGSVKTTATIP